VRIAALHAMVESHGGLCTDCDVFFPIDGARDPSSVPPSAAPDASATPDDAIVMIDADPSSSQHGRMIPLRVEWNAPSSRLAVRPARGISLGRGRRYVAAITSKLRAEDGTPLAASEAFLAARDGSDPSVARVAAHLAPALDELEAAGVRRGDVVAVASFTTEDPTALLRSTRDAVHAGAAPIAVVDHVWPRASLDDLLGVPAELRAGADVPAAEGTEGTRAIVHETTALVIAGRFGAPRVVTGEGGELGEVRFDASGAVEAGPTEDVPFLLIIPEGADLAHLPVVIAHHGFAATRTFGFVLADTAGRAGAAVLAIDAFQHGARAPSAHDDRNEMRDLDGADGIEEHTSAEVASRAFSLSGVPDGTALHPGYAQGTFVQFAADAMSAVRFAVEGDVSAIRATSPELATLAFDPSRVFFVGQSMGALVGQLVLPIESELAGVVLNVPPGSFVDLFSESAEFRGIGESVLLPLLRVRGSFDEETRQLVFEPIIDFFRWALSPVDPLALARAFVREPVAPGMRPDVLVQLGSVDEVAAPPSTESVMRAAGIPGTGAFEFAPIEPITLPAQANVDTPEGAISAALVRWDPGTHNILSELHGTSTYAPPIEPPFVRRDAPITVTNPIAGVHAQIETFLRTRIEGGRASIE
jgi:hypothetical protein